MTAFRLSELPYQQPATVVSVEDMGRANAAGVTGTDVIAQRLRELGFVPGELVRIVARGPIGADPLLVQVGYTRFALRRAEAARILVDPSGESATH